jgi:diguanylate cyclase (GGDEF)-like protein
VIALDLDSFKTVNDMHGHEAGDRVLVEVGAVLNRYARVGDLAARVGGEEFLVILHDTDSTGVLVAAERLRAQIETVTVPGVRLRVTTSVGVTVLEPRDLDPAAVLRRADAALYDAKHNGKNRVESGFLDVRAAVTFAAGSAPIVQEDAARS